MKKVEAPKTIETWRIVCAAQSEPDYSEDRQILYYGGRDDSYHRSYILLDGGHCSCYDWEEVEWSAIEYTKEELLALAHSKVNDDGWYYKSERLFWKSVILAVGDDWS